jgi:hypothetical protein
MRSRGAVPSKSVAPALQALIDEILCDVITPGHDEYDRARRVFNGAIDRLPHAIIRPHGVVGVATAVRYARQNGLPMTVRGGGHHFAGHTVIDGGVTIDLSLMRRVIVDRERRVARVEGGALWADVDRATQRYGLATPGGTVCSVGVGGFTLGGGIGQLSRAYGLAADNLLSVDRVTADGRWVTASEGENESLFWAIRGGGGGFGVVTSLEFRLHELPTHVYGGPVGYRIEDAPRVLRLVRDLMISAPDELNVSATIAKKDGQLILALDPFWVGEPCSGESIVRPLRDAATPIFDSYGPASYLALQSLDAPGGRRGWESSAFLDQMFDDTIDALIALAAGAPIAAPRIAILPLGGAIARVPESATSFGGRGATWLVAAGGAWDDASAPSDCGTSTPVPSGPGSLASAACGCGSSEPSSSSSPAPPACTPRAARNDAYTR